MSSCRALVYQRHSIALQLLKANGPPSHGENERLDRPIDSIAFSGRPVSIGSGGSETCIELVAEYEWPPPS